jgi:hypothetical protein
MCWMYLMLQFAHAFSVSGIHNERNMTSKCTTFILSSCKGNEVGQAKKPDNSLWLMITIYLQAVLLCLKFSLYHEEHQGYQL